MPNFKKALYLSLALSIFGATSQYSQAQDYSKYAWLESTSKNGYTYKYVNNDPTQARHYTLKNGLTVLLSVDKQQPRIQTYIAVKAGSKTDPSTHTGLAHYLEHMLFKGTDKFGTLDWEKEKPLLDEVERLYEKYNATKDEAARKLIYKAIDSVSGIASKYAIANEYDKMMENMGAQGTNAFTSFEQTVYVEDIPSNAIDKFLALQAERFRKPVLRLFHTELEAVYEEKNISLDNDGRKASEMFFKLMFPSHNYGQQTTIGTIEHLKNPSLKEIQKYFDNYYVPNNMGIIMSGDFDPDELIAKIDKAFGYMQPKEVKPYTFTPEKDITSPIKGDVYGPNPETLIMGFRLPGASTKDARILNVLSNILTNGSAGLIDLNLVQKQALLGAYAFPYTLKDYSMLYLQANPKEGQNLDEVRDLLLAQIQNLKSGNFSDDLLAAIVNNTQKQLIEEYDNYNSRANILMENFTTELDWKNQVAVLEEMKSLKKQDIIDFANNYFKDNYVVVYKHQGEDPTKIKVEKPEITPVSVNRDAQSPFLQAINNMPENAIQPQWLDYNKDIQKGKLNKYELLTVQNKNNELFDLIYYYNIGSWNSKVLSIAADFINYIGTNKKSAEAISQEFYKLASEFSVRVGTEQTYVTLSGLNQNLTTTVALFDGLLKNAKADNEVWEGYKQRLIKSRVNAKENKGQIMRGLTSYAKYGADNPFNYVLTDDELNKLKVEDIIKEIKNLLNYEHQVLYYGPSSINEVSKTLALAHVAPKKFETPVAKKVFTELDTKENNVLFANFKMVQADITWVRNGSKYDVKNATTNAVFNQYFGGGMGSLVFQTIRESKALAYSTYSVIGNPATNDRKLSVSAFVGTQADKFKDATAAMNELLNVLPESSQAIEGAKIGMLKQLSSERVTKQDILFSYLSAKRMGRDYDIRKNVYESTPSITYNNLKTYHANEMSNKPFTYCIVADENNLSVEQMSTLGKVQKLDLKTIFGY